MKISLLFCFCLSLIPFLVFGEKSEGIYPTVAYGVYKKNKLPVFDVDGISPVSQQNGKRVKLPARTITIERSDFYNPGFIEIMKSNFKGSYKGARSIETSARVTGSTTTYEGNYTASVKAAGNLENLYLVALCLPTSSADEGNKSKENINFTFKKLGTISDNAIVEIDLDVAFEPQYLDTKGTFRMLTLFYSNGYEVRSSASSEIHAYFRKKEETFHERLLSEYIENNSGKTMNYTPIIRFLPYIPPAIFKRQGAIDTTAVLTMDKTGKVRKVDLGPDEMDSEAATCLTDGLKDWLFLPPLKEGAPHPFRIKVPLKY